ncbi:MAG: lysoplasmalogenase [Clostridia bacterium]|nr:lysoplasmalogenase [Clostridia bacterium]MBR6823163.1 lysoplasmalogenase [Clostridia bacterium]
MHYIFLVLCLITSVLHLIASFKDDKEWRKRTKPLLLFFLLLFYLLAPQEKNVFLILALIFSWLGDILLMGKGNTMFTIGGISFGLSHLFFILTFTGYIIFEDVNPVFVVLLFTIYAVLSYIVIKLVKDTTPKKMVVPMYVYLIFNTIMNLFAFMQTGFGNRQELTFSFTLVSYIGAALFFISDCVLFIVRYYKDPEAIWKKHFTVMLTYLLAELLIVLGVLYR